MTRRVFAALSIALAFLLFESAARPASAFTQYVEGMMPMGHEWVTRMAAIELFGHEPRTAPDIPDPNDPRKTWTQGLARNTDLSTPGAQAELRRIKERPFEDKRYRSRYKAVYDAIVGERWVDLGGSNVFRGRTCWDAAVQEPADIQYDHFMRRYDDRGAAGGVTAAEKSRQRFIAYFVAAAMAPQGAMAVYDGGAEGSAAVEVESNYFLFGRAAHLFEDSFSSEHTVRDDVDGNNYVRLRQVKSYVCAAGSEQHTHSLAEIVDYASGDVIWKPGTQMNLPWSGYKASNMKDNTLVATEATKDLWAAFVRTMGTPMEQREPAARAEAATLADNWLSYDEREMLAWYDDEARRGASYVKAEGQSGKGNAVAECMTGLNVGTDDQIAYVRKLEATQRTCLYNMVPQAGSPSLVDASLHFAYLWRWRNGPFGKLEEPPEDWRIPASRW